MDTCQRCGKRCEWHGHPSTLIGGVTAVLCTTCVTAWNKFFQTHPLANKVYACDARKAFLDGCAQGGQPPSEEDWLAWRHQYATVAQEWHGLGQAWVDTPVPMPPREAMTASHD